jgi:hypothetical protein
VKLLSKRQGPSDVTGVPEKHIAKIRMAL